MKTITELSKQEVIKAVEEFLNKHQTNKICVSDVIVDYNIKTGICYLVRFDEITKEIS